MKRFILLVLVLLACSAPVGAQDAPPPPHGRTLTDTEYLGLIQAATTGMASAPNISGCGSNIAAQPDVCARQIVKLADALAVELRRSENWPE